MKWLSNYIKGQHKYCPDYDIHKRINEKDYAIRLNKRLKMETFYTINGYSFTYTPFPPFFE